MKMLVVILAVVFSYAFAAPTSAPSKLLTLQAKPETTPANPGLEIQELIILRDFYKDKKPAKSKEYEDRLAPKKANLYNLMLAASKLPNFGGFHSFLKYLAKNCALCSALLIHLCLP